MKCITTLIARSTETANMTTLCDRCFRETKATIMSTFNQEIICMACKEKERAHPAYPRAQAAEAAAVRSGDYSFPGLGKPDDL